MSCLSRLSRPNQVSLEATIGPDGEVAALNTADMDPLDDSSKQVLPADGTDRLGEWSALRAIRSTEFGQEPVQHAQTLIDRVGFGNAIGVLRIKLAFTAVVFALAARPLIDGFAEFVQLLPAVASAHFGRAGGQLQRGLTTALRALDRRRGQILPRGAAPEVIGAQAHRWTYAVFAAALLRDMSGVGKGLRIGLVDDDGSFSSLNFSMN